VIFPFFAFRIMVTVGLLMLTLVVWGNWMRRGERLFSNARLLFLLPVILMYSGWSYWVFRGKVRADAGYH
jgi:cytochrome bd-type quinol oxidase subunit 1